MASTATLENPPASDRSGAAAGSRRMPRLLLEVVIALVLIGLVRAFLVESFFVPSGSMEPTVMPADRVLVNKLTDPSTLQRGDVIVFDGTDVFAQSTPQPPSSLNVLGRVGSALGLLGSESDYLKRVVGVPGDRVVCCTASGALTINGVSVEEDYLPESMPAGDSPFDVIVPPDRLFVLGDNRRESSDSRAHLGRPGGGMVPFDEVIGAVSFRFWPLSRAGSLPETGAFDAVGRGGP